jgi:hypothetical protein
MTDSPSTKALRIACSFAGQLAIVHAAACPCGHAADSCLVRLEDSNHTWGQGTNRARGLKSTHAIDSIASESAFIGGHGRSAGCGHLLRLADEGSDQGVGPDGITFVTFWRRLPTFPFSMKASTLTLF